MRGVIAYIRRTLRTSLGKRSGGRKRPGLSRRDCTTCRHARPHPDPLRIGGHSARAQNCPNGKLWADWRLSRDAS
jgi:hypothetical protein